MKKRIIVALLFLILIGSVGLAQANFPSPTGLVNDFAGIISTNDRASLEQLLRQLRNLTTAEVAVVTIDTTEPLDLETYSGQLFEAWKIGKKEKDNGILLLVAIKDKKVRIEVGYGLEGAIPDALAKQIIETAIIPYFKQGDYSGGIMAGTSALVGLIAKEYNIAIDSLPAMPEKKASSKVAPFSRLLFYLLFFAVFGVFRGLLMTSARGRKSYHRRGGYWYGTGVRGSSGGFSGGFGGFGGGFSGGGGASGGW